MGRWRKKVGAVSSAYGEVLVAELEALRADLRRSSKGLTGMVTLRVAGAVVLFWTLAVFLFFLYRLLTDLARLSPLAASASLTLVMLLLGLGLLYLGARKMRGVEPIPRVLQRHFDGHLEWVRGNLMPPNEAQVGVDGGNPDAEGLPSAGSEEPR